MEITTFKNKDEKGFFLKVDEDEAISIIKSLSSQLLSKSPNDGRKEYYTEKGEYFTIGVTCEKDKMFQRHLDTLKQYQNMEESFINAQNKEIQELRDKIEKLNRKRKR